MTSYTQTKTTKEVTTQSKVSVKTPIDKYQSRINPNNKNRSKHSSREKGKVQNYQPKHIQKNNIPETEQNRRGDTKTDTKKEGDYLIIITTAKKAVGGIKP